ncbi:threonine aldolase family protein [Streptomyces sp. NBC_01264]|uniref:threonine aldolase family protein n=1 Tax=Streptomyces sp. NBC_01264 TaxID=2903804 RepID=UPI003D2FA46A
MARAASERADKQAAGAAAAERADERAAGAAAAERADKQAAEPAGGAAAERAEDRAAGAAAAGLADAQAAAERAEEEAADAADAVAERLVVAGRAAARKLSYSLREATVGELLAELAGLAPDSEEPADIYGNGIVERLERRVAELLGTEDAAFFPTGTMAQQIALRCWAARTGNPVVALHPMSHPERWEGGALSVVSGLRTVHPTGEPRQPTASELAELPEPFGTLMLELPLRDAGFLLPTWEELSALVDTARERDAVVHFDGARLWESTVHFGRTLPEIAALADSVYVSFYKSLGGLSGAALAGSASLVAESKVWRHRYGGQIFRQFPAALSALAGLERELPELPSYVAKARTVASALASALAAAPEVPWFRVHPEVPHTHQFQVWLPYDADRLTEAGVRLAEETGTVLFRRWSPDGPPGLSVTEVEVTRPGLSWTESEVATAVADFVARL